DEAAFAETKIEAALDGTSRFADQVPAGDPDIGNTVGHELRYVLGADEQRLELAAERGGESPVTFREHRKSGVPEELAGVVGESSFVGQCDLEHVEAGRGKWEAGSGKREEGSGKREEGSGKQKARPGMGRAAEALLVESDSSMS